MDDETSPRRPQDPPWRSRTAHRSSAPAAMQALRGVRLRRGWSMTRAAGETGVSRPMISQLERGQRRPSVPLAEALIAGYQMTAREAEAVRSIALEYVGRDSPFRTGVSPPWAELDTSWDTQGNGAHRTDPGTDGATGRASPVASADDWIEWARRKAEAARNA